MKKGTAVHPARSGIVASTALYKDIHHRYSNTHPKSPPILKPPAAAFTAGYKAFLIWVPFFNNPYLSNPSRGLWINGYKKAERETRMRDLWYTKGRDR